MSATIPWSIHSRLCTSDIARLVGGDFIAIEGVVFVIHRHHSVEGIDLINEV